MGLRRRTPVLLAVLAAGSLAACRSAAPRTAPATPAPATVAGRPAALADPVHWVRDSAEYRGLALQTYATAARAVEERAAGKATGTWAVVLDADETVLDNSLYQKERAAIGQGFSSESWRAWVARKEAGAVPGAAAFLARVQALGGRIAIVTNRTAAECDDTRANLQALTLPFDVLLCRTDTGDKGPRFEAVAHGTAGQPPLEVLAFVGDNIQDFPGMGQDVRKAPAEGLAEFGRRYFLLPNPMYGSWEKNPAQ
jgi:5'-nucleotidase (lipoprotein e(P4) family)